jgi:hypothetical protein
MQDLTLTAQDLTLTATVPMQDLTLTAPKT